MSKERNNSSVNQRITDIVFAESLFRYAV